MSVKETLEALDEQHSAMKKTFKELINAVKQECTRSIQEYIDKDDFESANKVIKNLDSFTKINFETNIDFISKNAKDIILEKTKEREVVHSTNSSNKTAQTLKENSIEKEQSYASVSVLVESNDEVNSEEKELINLIGYSSVSRIKDTNTPINENTLLELEKKELILMEKMSIGEESFSTFELTEKGKEKFKEWFGIEANESLKTQLTKKYNNTEKGYFLYDIENALNERDFKIHDLSVAQIEISKDNRHCYLTPDIGDFKKEQYIKTLNRKNQLRNIGFICSNDNVMQEAIKYSEKWAEENKQKSKFLTINFTNMKKLENEEEAFFTLTF